MSSPLPVQQLDIQRHREVFAPGDFIRRGHRVAISSAGPVGSRLGRHLAELGIPFTIYDSAPVAPDFVGAFGKEDWGKPRSAALREMLFRDTGIAISAFSRTLNSDEEPGNIVFLTDGGLAERQALLDRFRDGPAGVDAVFDVRADDAASEIHFLEPRWRWQLKPYRRSLAPSSWEKFQGLTVPVIAEYAAGAAAFQLIEWFADSRLFYEGKEPEEIRPGLIELSLRCPLGRLEAIRNFAAEFRRSGLRVSVLGAGALGSRLGRHLAELGISFDLIDYDKVESQNIPNQAFGLGEIGMFKAEALARIAERDFFTEESGLSVLPRLEKFDGSQPLGEIVFVCPDNMNCRDDVWQKVRLSEETKLVIEGRMGEVWGKVYTAFPRAPLHLREYGKTLHRDEDADGHAPAQEAEPGACRATTTVGPTAECIASRMVWQLIRWFVSDSEERNHLGHEIFAFLKPYEVFSKSFS